MKRDLTELTHELILTSNARTDLQCLDTSIRTQIRRKLEWLCENCDNRRHTALKGEFRFKTAKDYRVLYTFNRQTRVLTVSRIQHRSTVY